VYCVVAVEHCAGSLSYRLAECGACVVKFGTVVRVCAGAADAIALQVPDKQCSLKLTDLRVRGWVASVVCALVADALE